jgi:RNA 3'-terminal phosphate cyclase (ATP)
MPRAGFYPVGGGQLDAWIEPAVPQPISRLDRGPLKRVYGVAGVCNLRHGNIAERMRDTALSKLSTNAAQVEIALVEWPGAGQGAAISLTAEYEFVSSTFVGLGERGKPAEAVARDAIAELLAYENQPGAVDPHSADQLVLPLALAAGKSEFTTTEVTEHLRTNIATVRAFLEREIRLDEHEDGPARVTID